MGLYDYNPKVSGITFNIITLQHTLDIRSCFCSVNTSEGIDCIRQLKANILFNII
jgi:hypothetical protein